MNNLQFIDLFRPLSPSERERLEVVVPLLFSNPDFVLLFRYMNTVCGGVASTSFRKLDDAMTAAWIDGQKSVARDLLDRAITNALPRRESELTQETETK